MNMAYTEKVLLSGTALSFLLYECVNSVCSQEGFLIGDVTSEITNHISDSQSDNARLDTKIVIKTVLPLPSVSLFYLPTGRIKEDVLSSLLSNSASEVVGWYRYRRNSNIKPTFRDKLISKGLQKYFEKHHGKKTFVSCSLSNKVSPAGSTHTFMYRFGKINCFDMYEYIEDVTANLGEKLTGYKKAHKISTQSIFNNIVDDINVQRVSTPSDAILRIQEAVNIRLLNEAKIAVKNECSIKELEAEIKQMTSILSDKQCVDLHAAYDKIQEEKLLNKESEMAEACIEALKSKPEVDILSTHHITLNTNNLSHNKSKSITVVKVETRSLSPVLISKSNNIAKPGLDYAAALKKQNEKASTSKSNAVSEDLITFDEEDKSIQIAKPIYINDEVNCLGNSSPEY